jgi:hypothetical protein
MEGCFNLYMNRVRSIVVSLNFNQLLRMTHTTPPSFESPSLSINPSAETQAQSLNALGGKARPRSLAQVHYAA